MKKMCFGITSVLFFSLLSSTVFAQNGNDFALDISEINTSNNVTVMSGSYQGQHLPAKLINGSLYIKGESLLIFADTFRSDAATRTDILEFKDEVQVEMLKQTSIQKKNVIVDLEETVKNELAAGYIPVRQVFELAGYKVNYQGINHFVSLTR